MSGLLDAARQLTETGTMFYESSHGVRGCVACDAAQSDEEPAAAFRHNDACPALALPAIVAALDDLAIIAAWANWDTGCLRDGAAVEALDRARRCLGLYDDGSEEVRA